MWKWTWIPAAGVVLVCAAIEVYALVDRSNGEPRNKDIRRYVLGEIAGDTRVDQQFHVRADGLSSVTIYPRRMHDNPIGSATVLLSDVTPGDEIGVLDLKEVLLSALSDAEALTLRFPPQPSRGREYRIEFTVAGVPRGQGIGLLAARGEGYRRAFHSINGGRPRWGDLVFETTVEGATSNFGSIAAQLDRGGVPASRVVLALLLLVKNGILFMLIYALTAAHTPTRTLEEPTAGVS